MNIKNLKQSRFEGNALHYLESGYEEFNRLANILYGNYEVGISIEEIIIEEFQYTSGDESRDARVIFQCSDGLMIAISDETYDKPPHYEADYFINGEHVLLENVIEKILEVKKTEAPSE